MGMAVHGSYANMSGKPRRAFATHYMYEGSWVERCDLQSHVSTDDVVGGAEWQRCQCEDVSVDVNEPNTPCAIRIHSQ
jgi:hypothetical protein